MRRVDPVWICWRCTGINSHDAAECWCCGLKMRTRGINCLNDEVSSCLARGENAGLTQEEMIAELRRIADELAAENAKKRRRPRRAGGLVGDRLLE